MCDMPFSVEAVVRGCHEYKDIWVAVVGEKSCLPCNREDRFAVAVVKDSNVVGHIPRKISSICSVLVAQVLTLRKNLVIFYICDITYLITIIYNTVCMMYIRVT